MSLSIYCPYCHKYTELSQRGRIQTSQGIYSMGECNSCHNVVLVQETTQIGARINRVYPRPLPTSTDERIPEYIKKDINEAKLCFSVGAFRACAVMARRAVQNACIDKGANKNKRLEEQIEELASKGVITNNLKEWADVVRWVGNDAAHPDKNEVIREDAEDILKLAEQFMHVIYVAPAIAKEQREKRGK